MKKPLPRRTDADADDKPKRPDDALAYFNGLVERIRTQANALTHCCEECDQCDGSCASFDRSPVRR